MLSILWIFFIANLLVDLITLLGVLLNMDSTFLGITVLAMGMSIADLKVNAAVAKQGFARMALTGCFAGPMFNLLIGLGSSIVMTIAKGNNPPEFKFKDKDGLLPLIAVFALFCELIVILILS